MSYASIPENQIPIWLRNSDIMTTAERGVTTDNDTGTFSSDSEHLINVSNVKNIRSIEVDSTVLTFGTDYDYDIDYNDSGTIKTKIIFTTAQTGDYDIEYDYGTDKIHTDYPREDLKLTSYPRIAVILIADNSDAFGVGGDAFIENDLFTFLVFSENQDWIRKTVRAIKSQLQIDAKNFYNFPFVKPTTRGPIIKSEGRNQKILQGSIDAVGMFKVTNI